MRVTRLIVLSDDWGRHPSSCQHLVRALLDRYPVTWVNTIGMRQPGFSRGDLAKIARRLRIWGRMPGADDGSPALPANLDVLTPVMWPRFHRTWERRLNATLVSRAVSRALASSPHSSRERRVLLTTLPIAAPLLDRLPIDAVVYYCVDDHSAWPGLDGRVMHELEQQLVRRADRIVAASSALQQSLSSRGHDVALLTHGVDLDLWRRNGDRGTAPLPAWAGTLRQPIAAFWGLIDRRLDSAWLHALMRPSDGFGGSLLLAGPLQDHDPALAALDRVVLPGSIPYSDLPQLAALADVLVMPYADSAATRAMQPLKLKEYLATSKPVVARDLPALREWADAVDLVGDAPSFVRAVADRARSGTPARQLQARQRVLGESWHVKAAELETLMADCLSSAP